MKQPKSVGVDRITELPECIIHRIMSRISAKELARTSVLSKRWFRVEKNYPVLQFSLKEKTKHLVYKSLHHFSQEKLSLQTFCLYLADLNLSSDLDSLTRLALENHVKELRLSLSDNAVHSSLCTLPLPVFSSKTLTVLKLSSCFLDQPLSAFSFLKNLHLESCRVDGQMILKNADCPLLEDLVLEDLVLENCEGFGSVYISNLAQLHSVEISFDDEDGPNEFVISCQSLQSFTISVTEFKPWFIINMDGCDHLKFLHLRSEVMTDSEFRFLLSKLPLLEELYLFRCDRLKTINISSPRLKTLEICLEPESHGQVDFIGIEAPDLRHFILITEDQRCVIKIDNCHKLETMVLFWKLMTDALFHNLVSQFPLLENLWVNGCQKLQRIEIPNLRLKRLHIVRCFRLKAVKVDSPTLLELCCTGREAPELLLAARNATGGLRFERDHDDSSSWHWSYRLKNILTFIVGVKDDSLIEVILSAADEYWMDYRIYKSLSN